jgi:hypothetical protein
MTPTELDRLARIRSWPRAVLASDVLFLLDLLDRALADVEHGKLLVRDLCEEKGVRDARRQGQREALDVARGLVLRLAAAYEVHPRGYFAEDLCDLAEQIRRHPMIGF